MPFLSYDTLMTSVPVLGAEQFQFPLRVILAISAQTGSNWFVLILQTAKLPTKKSRIRETKHFWTDADSSTDTIVGWTKKTQKPDFF